MKIGIDRAVHVAVAVRLFHLQRLDVGNDVVYM